MNRLSRETSPYLRQHARNPVDWYPWGEEALQRAHVENKPLLVSIGYSTCHWCHVMERESFEDENVASFMNEHFINVKIDREERPDLDAIYMDAVQAMTGQGGWPLNVFLLPGGKPFYGGTYFPPRSVQGRASWMEVLTGVAKAFTERRNEMDAQAENLTAHLIESNRFGEKLKPEASLFTEASLLEMGKALLQQADKQYGGFGKAPKFPQTFSIRFLLQLAQRYGWEEARAQALFSLDKMIAGGLFDQLGGGFARYSTDSEWKVPHFEKMLYDNALLVETIAEAYQVTGLKKYQTTLRQVRAFLERELLDPQGGFYAALDADSEGVEGKFYVWSFSALQEVLGDDLTVFSAYYEVSEEGNWEDVNVLRVVGDAGSIAAEQGKTEEEIEMILERCRGRLLAHRAKRIRPALDHKILLGWNALMQSACTLAYRSTADEAWFELGKRNMQFLMAGFCTEDGQWKHVVTDGYASGAAFLDDRAYLIKAWIDWHTVTGDWHWLHQANQLTEDTVFNFSDPNTSFFCFASPDRTDLILHKKEIYDGAIPSANAVMAENLFRLGTVFGKQDWIDRSETMVATLGQALKRYPGSFGYWSRLLSHHINGLREITITGPEARDWVKQLGPVYLPDGLVLVVPEAVRQVSRFSDSSIFDRTTVQVCRKNTCQTPVFSSKELLINIKNGDFGG